MKIHPVQASNRFPCTHAFHLDRISACLRRFYIDFLVVFVEGRSEFQMCLFQAVWVNANVGIAEHSLITLKPGS